MKKHRLWIPLMALLMVSITLGQPGVVWETTLGGPLDDSFVQIKPAHDGGFYVVWKERVSSYVWTGKLSKLSSGGAREWDIDLSVTNSGKGAVCEYDDGIFVTQTTDQQTTISKYSFDGDSLWTTDANLPDYELSGKPEDLIIDENGTILWLGSVYWSDNGDLPFPCFVVRRFGPNGEFIDELGRLSCDGYSGETWIVDYRISSNVNYIVLVGGRYPEGTPWQWTEWVSLKRINTESGGIQSTSLGHGYPGLPYDALSVCPMPTQDGFYILMNEYFDDCQIRSVVNDSITTVVAELVANAREIELADDGGILLLYNNNDNEDLDIGLQKLDHNFEEVWDTAYGGELREAGSELIKLPGGDLLIVGSTRSYGAGGGDIYLVRVSDSISNDPPPAEPVGYVLRQAYPNPFNPSTEIEYAIARAGDVSLKVYDVLGREVASLVNGLQNAGKYTVQFDGAELPSGVYIYRLQAGEFTQSRKLVLLK